MLLASTLASMLASSWRSSEPSPQVECRAPLPIGGDIVAMAAPAQMAATAAAATSAVAAAAP